VGVWTLLALQIPSYPVKAIQVKELYTSKAEEFFHERFEQTYAVLNPSEPDHKLSANRCT
jgi:hypothetical protein